jgi:polyhydroxyalkanoate synthase
MLETYGNMPAWLINSRFNSMAPLHHLFDKYVGLHRDREGFAENFNLFEKWRNSDVPMAGQIFCEMTMDLGQTNRLVKGEFEVGGRLVDLKRITCPLLDVVGELDDVVPSRSSTPLIDLVASEDKRNLLFPTGHKGAAVSSSMLCKLWTHVTWLEEHDA